MWRARRSFLFALVLLGGCGRVGFDPGDASGNDAGDVMDASTDVDADVRTDAGSMPTDAGSTPTDAGSMPTDAGSVDAGPPMAWWDMRFGSRAPVTIDNRGREAMDDFPALVALTPGTFPYASAASDGSDLRFVDAAGTLLPHEIEVWDPAGTSVVWVRVRRVERDAATTITVYFDATDAVPVLPTTDVWATHRLVLHLAGDARDSSREGNHGTLVGPRATVGPKGAVDTALSFAEAGMHYVSVPASASLDSLDQPITITAIARHRADQDSYRAVVSRATGATSTNDLWLGYHTNRYRGILNTVDNPMRGIEITGPSRPLDTWQHLALVYDGAQLRYFVDGIEVASGASTGSVAASSNPFHIGADANSGGAADIDWFEGDVAEVWIETEARTTDWLRAQTDAIRGTLVTIGPAESR